MTTADLLDLLAHALADAARETRDLGPLPDHHWTDRARTLVDRMHPAGMDQGAPMYETTAMRHGLAPNTRPLGGVRVPGFTVSPGSTMTRPDVPHRSIPDSWRA